MEEGLGSTVQGLESNFTHHSQGCNIIPPEEVVSRFWCRVLDFGYQVHCEEFRISGFSFKVQMSGL
jgi:hypothetical protein